MISINNICTIKIIFTLLVKVVIFYIKFPVVLAEILNF